MAAELVRSGVPHDAAFRLAAHLALRGPLARRVGVPGMARWLARAGTPTASAREGAALLVALDALDAGRRFDDALGELARAGLSRAEAQGAVLEAARLRRAVPAAARADHALRTSLAAAAVGVAASAALVGIRLLIG